MRTLAIVLGTLLIAAPPLSGAGPAAGEEAIKRQMLMARVGLVPAGAEKGSVTAEAPQAASAEGVAGPYFLPEVQTLVAARCQVCHDVARTPVTGLPLRGEPEADYQVLRRLAGSGEPDDAPLLVVSRGEGHMAGPVLPMDSDGYALLRAWLAAGMPYAKGIERPQNAGVGVGSGDR
jgi:cytochrome c5